MKILHLCNDFLGSKVHANLYEAIGSGAPETQQVVFVPTRKAAHGKNTSKTRLDNGVELVYSKPIKNWHRLVFRTKCRFLYGQLTELISLKDIDVCHATTLYSDGFLAYKLYREYGIPYILSVRGTDINLFLTHRPDLLFLMKKVFENAHKVVFISPSLKDNFFHNFWVANLLKLSDHKAVVIPNGVDAAWLSDTIHPRTTCIHEGPKLIFVGKFNRNKNVLRVAKNVIELRQKSLPNISLTLVGQGGAQEKELRKLASAYSFIRMTGPVYDKEALKTLFRSHNIFIMISRSETFGLVYIEALTQGLPIIYTKNQGIDGYFHSFVGNAVNPKSNKEIKDSIHLLSDNYNILEVHSIDFSLFHWSHIAQTYFNLYQYSLTHENSLPPSVFQNTP